MKRKGFHTVVTHEETRRRWSHPDPADMKRLVAGDLEPKRASALRRHLRCCVGCSLLAGRVAAVEGAEGFEGGT